MTTHQHAARRLRMAVLMLGLLFVLFALAWTILPIFTPTMLTDSAFEPMGILGTPLGLGVVHDSEKTYAVNVLIVLGAVLIAQWWFLRPRGAWIARLATTGRPLRGSVIVAAAMAMLLTLGAVALVLELPDMWAHWMDKDQFFHAAPFIFGGMAVVWTVWFLIFWNYWRQGDRYTQFGRMIRGLVGGSLIEAFVAIPVHVVVSRQRECYCARGTYTTLICAGTVLLWAFGPGIMLLYAREKYRQVKLFPRCTQCDYDLRGSVSGACPECGATVERTSATR